uniref:Si:ch211-214j8.12 n=1 Tax=Acanthochromis polyacanthus TaxID=80966 RepID=A0A3Q1EWN5_9TELE
MPLFRALDEHGGTKARPGQRGKVKSKDWMGSCWRTDEDGSVLSLTRLCLLSLADNMKDVWVKDYADKYLDHFSFSYIMGPFNLLPGDLVEELTRLLCTRKQLSLAALHLLLVPQLRGLSLELCPGLVTSALCGHIAARCQGLWSLDLSGAKYLRSKVLSETLHSLPALRSLSLAGLPCDRCVIMTVAHCCRLLRHLNVSHCHLLSPASLLPLGGSVSRSPSGSLSPTLPPLPLCSLLALDIGFGEKEGDSVVAAAYLLLSLPCLERLAVEGVGQACFLIECRDFSQADEFTDREGVRKLEEVWRERKQAGDSWRKKRERAAADREQEDEDEEECLSWEGYASESEEDASRDEGPSCSENQTHSGLILRLKEVKGITCHCLDHLGQLCPGICSISVNADNHEDAGGRSQGSLLATGLQTWSGQLQSFSVHFPGPLVDLHPALQVAGSSLVSLTLEGVTTSPHSPLLEVIRACPRLRDLLISAEPPTTVQEEDVEGDQQDDQDLPQLPYLCSLTLNFSYEHSRMKPIMSWMSLKKVLRCLLAGSPLLEKLSLVSLPCPLNCILQNVLHVSHLHASADSTLSPPMPLGRLQHVDLLRTDVMMATVKGLMQQSKRLKRVDVSYCWQISKLEWSNCKTFRKVQVVWV